MKKINILFLDIEGGHGGSSKSLFMLIKNLKKKNITSHIFCKRSGYSKNYKKLGVLCKVKSKMPTFTALKRLNRNFIYSLFFIFYFWPNSYKVRNEILDYIDDNKIEIIHSNLISFFILVYWIKKRRPKIKFTLHSRTLPYNNLFSKLQARISFKLFDGFVFITENEKAHFEKLINKKVKGKIIYNSVELKKINKKVKLTDNKKELKILALSNYSYQRGTDRIIEIAKELKNNNINNITFYIA